MQTKGVKKEATTLRFGTKVVLSDTALYRTSTYPASHRRVSGVFYLYDGVEENGRYKIVRSKAGIRYKQQTMVVEGFITKEDAIKCASI